jgi:hypothetical protein
MLMHDEYDAAGFTAPSPMEGHGAYNRSSHVQAAGLAAAIPLLRLAAETAPLAPAPEPIVIADYGAIEKMVIPTYGRTRAEFVAPFDESGQIAGLALASVEIFLGEDHIYEDYERVGDAGAFGRRWAAFVRASTFPTLARALEGGGEERAERFYDLLEARLAARLSAATGPNIIPLAKLLLVKQGSGGHDGLRQTIIATASAANLGRVLRPPHPRQFREGDSGRIRFQTEGTTMRLLALAAGLLIAATIVPVSADAGPVRAAARGTATAVAVTGKTAAKGTVVVGRTAVRGTAAAARTTGRGAVCVATFFRACGRYYP